MLDWFKNRRTKHEEDTQSQGEICAKSFDTIGRKLEELLDAQRETKRSLDALSRRHYREKQAAQDEPNPADGSRQPDYPELRFLGGI
jgi:hypothetical protein